EAHPSQWIGDKSIEFIEKASSEGKPWFLMSSYIHPHPPFTPPKPWHKLYRSPDMPLPHVPENAEELYTWINLKQNRYKYRDRGIDKNLMRNIKAFYYATISFVDFQVGRIIKVLEEKGELDNTLILFTSDHGEYLGDYNCFGKRSMHDACNVPVNLVDVLPTLANAARADISDIDLDGCDMAELASGGIKREYVYSQFSEGASAIYMIVSKEWKYFYSAGDNREYFFDRNKHPQESHNLAEEESAKAEKEKIKQNLLGYLKENKVIDAWIECDGVLDWKEYEHFDESYLDDPDANLLVQDYDPYEWTLEGYSD
ncbi:MAG: sulfatase family protein, partial [Planctomycetota bacterium]